MRLINAEALKKAIMLKDNVAYETWDELYDSVLEEIDNAPTVQLTELCKGCQYLKDCETCDKNERPQGEWIGGCKCSVCGNFSNDNGDFCTNCGAQMEKEGKE